MTPFHSEKGKMNGFVYFFIIIIFKNFLVFFILTNAFEVFPPLET